MKSYRIMSKQFFILFLITLLFATSSANAIYKKDGIRVAILKDKTEATISGKSLVIQAYGSNRGQPIFRTRSAKIIFHENGFLVNNELISQNRIAVKSSTPTFEVNGKSYRGDLDIYHEGNGTLVVVNNLKLEDYLVGVVNSEVPSNWPTEAKKAQAVAARTYALYQKKYREDPTQSKLYDVEATMMDQVYHGVAREDKNTELLVYQTKGETLFHNGKLIKAFFHSCSGGQTTTGEQVWQKKYGMEGINDPYSENCPNNDWTYLITPNQLIQVLKKDGLTISSIKEIKVLNNQNVNRVDDIKIISDKGSISLSANKLRMLVGPKKIRSTNFIITTEGNSFKFTGKGFGHGVGLSQWGAKNMADKGFGYKDILEFYYPKAKLGRAY